MVYLSWTVTLSSILVKKNGLNGNVRGLGNKRKLDLNIFIQMTINSFAEKEFRTPRDWCDIVDAIIMHCKGDHSHCSILERYKDQISKPYHMDHIIFIFKMTIFDLTKV